MGQPRHAPLSGVWPLLSREQRGWRACTGMQSNDIMQEQQGLIGKQHSDDLTACRA